ncbi:cytochrome P450 monooxygenase [Vararia minispora EC-137]|uniref:Cytochrome P450 monooxygenase n=1 Tax=Vararia minispora EC-137 TaxID=1314806 RepID=A0ACB8Q8R6_9AGAM|nr:cytochrome P450 monooxygenase [Vararia minispora EC-137]
MLSHWISARRLSLPPGPPPDPVLGNIRHMPFEQQEKAFADWSKVYGDVIYTQVLGRSMIILNSLKAARDLLEKRSAIYSCRPRLVLICEMMGWHLSLVHMPYGSRSRKHRKWILEYFSESALPNHYHVQREAVAGMLLGLLDNPKGFLEHVKLFSAGVIIRIAYGHKIKSSDDRFFRLADEATEITVASGTSQGGLLVDFIPILRHIPAWMPGAGFKRVALKAREKVAAMHDAPFQMVREKMAAGDLIPSFTSRLLAENDNQLDLSRRTDHAEIRGAAGTLYAGTFYSTAATISAFFLAMARNPDIYAKAQAEIDTVVGPDRLPDVGDRLSLPFVEAVLIELYRFPYVGVPHRSTQRDHYRGFELPKDAVIMANAWAMSRDEEMYENPEEFRPERFLNLSTDDLNVRNPKNFVFGFGRRQCPGKDFADSNIWLLMVSILAAFDVTAPVNEAGEAQLPPEEYIPGFIRHVKPFSCKITVRNPQRAQQIMALVFASE